jgi:pyruvate/2-oxoglutarate dehydrogenase complex dihydrolipoamide dehydrogenase (E3) component
VGVAHDGDRAVIDCDDGSSVSGERLLVATGRVVDVGGLGLDTAGVSAADGFVEVDGRMRAADGIWAIGDVTGRAKLTSVAMYQGGIAASDILGEGTVGGDYRAVPRVTFTDPEVGAVGLTEGAARDAGHVVDVVVKDVAGSFRGWLHGPGNAGFVKLVIDRHRDVLLGATAAGPYGGEVLGLLNLAVHEEVQLGRLVSMEYGFPTFYGVIGECLGAYGRGTGKVLDPGFEPRVG